MCFLVKAHPCHLNTHAQIPDQMVHEGVEISKLLLDRKIFIALSEK